MRPILWRQQIDVLNGDPDHGIPTRIELQLCGPSDGKVPSADDPIVIVYSADDDPNLGDELRLPLAVLKEFIEVSDPTESAVLQLLRELRSKADRLKPYSPIWVRVDDLLDSHPSPPSTHTSDGSPNQRSSAENLHE